MRAWVRRGLGGMVLGLAVLGACSKKDTPVPAAGETAAPAATQPAAPAPGGQVALGTKHPCDLVPAAKLTQLIGFDPGTANRAGPACMYDAVNMLIDVPATYDLARKTNEKAGSVTDVPGLGDKAFITSIGPTTDLHAVKGDTYFNVVVVKDIPEARRSEIARAVMKELIQASGK